jgi:hypothetical protein
MDAPAKLAFCGATRSKKRVLGAKANLLRRSGRRNSHGCEFLDKK